MPGPMPVSLRRLGEWLLFGLLFAVLGFHIVRGAAELASEPCPASDTVFDRARAPTACPDER